MSDDDERIIDEFLASLPPVDESKRPANWPSGRHRIDLAFPPGPRAGEPVGSPISATFRLSDEQAHYVRQAAKAAGLEPAAWAQRHLLAAAGCPLTQVATPRDLLERIHAAHVQLDSVGAAKQ